MRALPQPVAERVGKMLPRLASEHDGEVVATARAIGRALRNAGFDFNDAAERFAAQSFPEPVFDEAPRSTGGRSWSTDFDPRPSWERRLDPYRDAVRTCQAAADRLTQWEIAFVNSIGPRVVHGLSLSARQQASLMSIVARLNS